MLPTPEQVKDYIAGGLACQHLEVEGDGQHFFATIVSDAFQGKRLIARHQTGLRGARRPHARRNSRAQHEDADARGMEAGISQQPARLERQRAIFKSTATPMSAPQQRS